MNRPADRLRQDAIAIYEAAVEVVEPRRLLTRALAATPPPERVWLIATGKAAFPMAAAAAQHLDRLEVPLAGGLVVTPDDGDPPDGRLRRLAGDHPVPGPRSALAADALEQSLAQLTAHDELWVLVSGGTSSLLGAPIEGVSPVEYDLLVQALARAGLPIGDLNRVRKRFSRWGAGRLAVRARAARVRAFVLSDVPGDQPADIGSGPCEPDPSTAAEIRALLDSVAASQPVPEALLRLLGRVSRGDLPETPKPGDPAFDRVTTRIVASNGTALDGAAARAEALGYQVIRLSRLITGEASAAGPALVREALAGGSSGPATAWIAGGETTVTLGEAPGIGGRCQELALAAARELARIGPHPPIVLLAGGTDGRDGPTDAAGAVVDSTVWATIAERGIDPARALGEHDAWPALAAAGALLRPGLTGTNVMDVMVVLAGERSADQSGSRSFGSR